MVDRNVVLARIAKIRHSLTLLRKFAALNEEAFLKDPIITASAERYLQVAIQAVIDIGNHVVADLDLGSPADYGEVFRLLGQHRIVPKALAKRLSLMAGLRNIIVHEYLEIDLELVHRFLRRNLKDFELFIAAVLALVQKSS